MDAYGSFDECAIFLKFLIAVSRDKDDVYPSNNVFVIITHLSYCTYIEKHIYVFV